MQEGRCYAERHTRVCAALQRLEQSAPELPRYFEALEHPAFRRWERLLDAAEALVEAHGRAAGLGRQGRLSERAYAWRVWRIANVYYGSTIHEIMHLEGDISRRSVQQARAAWERPSPRQQRLFRELGLIELESQAFRPLSQQTISDIFGPRLHRPRASIRFRDR
jgi:hypothetical protein